MFDPKDMARIISKAQRQAVVEATKLPKFTPVETSDAEKVVHSCKFDGQRMEALEAQVESLTDGFNTLTQALSDMNEELAKAQGMLKFCYAICQNPAIKDLADTGRNQARSSLGSLTFGKFGAGNRGGGSNGGGRGNSWRPSP